MNHQELIELLRYGSLCPVSGDGCEDKLKASDAIESLLAENERLKHNLAVTEQTMREYQELAAKRLEEIERLKDLCTTMDGQLRMAVSSSNEALAKINEVLTP